MTDPDELAAALADITGIDDLIDQAAAGIRRDRGKPAWTDDTRHRLAELTAAVATRHPQRLAEAAVTRWIITREPIPEALAVEIARGEWDRPAPRRGHVGFSPPGQPN